MLAKILQEGVGKKLAFKFNHLTIQPIYPYYTIYDLNFILEIFNFDRENTTSTYIFEGNSYDFEDEFDDLIDEEIDIDEPTESRTVSKFIFNIKKIKNTTWENVPVILDLSDYFEIVEVKVYSRKIGLNFKEFDQLKKKYTFYPELYIIHFRKGNLLIMYFDEVLSSMELFFDLDVFKLHILEYHKISIEKHFNLILEF